MLKKTNKLVCFQAHWCKPCHDMKDIIDGLEKDGYAVERVDVDSGDPRVAAWAIMSVPQYFSVDGGGQPIGQCSGKTTRDKLINLIEG